MKTPKNIMKPSTSKTKGRGDVGYGDWLAALVKIWKTKSKSMDRYASKVARKSMGVSNCYCGKAEGYGECAEALEKLIAANNQAQAQPPTATPERKGDNL